MKKRFLVLALGAALAVLSGCTSSTMRIVSEPAGAKVYTVDHSGWIGSGPQPNHRKWKYKCSAPCDVTYGNDIYAKVRWDDGEESRYIYIGYWDQGTRIFKKPTTASKAMDARVAQCQRPCKGQYDRCMGQCANEWLPRAARGENSAPMGNQACMNTCQAEANECNANCSQ